MDVIRDNMPCLIPALLAAMASTPRCKRLTATIYTLATHIVLVIYYHSSHAAIVHPLSSNVTQPLSPLLSEVDRGRGAGWEMRRCKRERRRILSVALILRDVSRYRRAFRRVRDT